MPAAEGGAAGGAPACSGDKPSLMTPTTGPLSGAASVASMTPRSVAPMNERALEHYLARRTLIESHVWGTFFATEKSTRQLMEINLEIAQTIIAALKLGSMELLGNDIPYIEQLLVSYQPSRERLRDYLLAYYQAAKIHLGEPAAPIVDWLAQLVASRNE